MRELTTAAHPQLEERDARKLCAKIKGAIDDATNLILQFYQQRGWQSMGYSTWTECCRTEFGKDHSWASRQIKKLGKVGYQTVSPDCQTNYETNKTVDVSSVPVTEDSHDTVDDQETANAIRETAEELGVMPEPPESETDPFLDNLTVIAAETTGRADVRRWLEDVALWHVKAFDEATAIMAAIVDYYKRGEAIGTARIENAIKALEQ